MASALTVTQVTDPDVKTQLVVAASEITALQAETTDIKNGFPFTGACSVAGALSSTTTITGSSGTAPPAGGTLGMGLLLSSTAALGLYVGSGAPAISAAKGSLYLRTDGSSTSTRLYSATDAVGTWTAITTAA